MSESGTRPDDATPAQRGGLVADLVMTLRFFSRLPIGYWPHVVPNLSSMATMLPLASLVIGALPAAILLLMTIIGAPPLFAALLAAAAFAIITGAMSEDAVADAADGLFGGTTPERRLEILKDSRHGTYGVLAIVFVVGLKVAALSAMLAVDPLGAAVLWLAATILARSGAMMIAYALPPARVTGAAAAAGRVSRNALLVGAVLALLIASPLSIVFAGVSGLLLALVLGGSVLLAWTRLCDRLVGGQTGDLIGAAQALVEIVVLGAFMVMVA